MEEIFKSKGFWVTILVGSFIGAFIALVMPSESDQYEITEFGYLCPPDVFRNGMPAIINPEDSVGLYDFRNLMDGKSNRARFKGLIVKRNWRVGLIKEDRDQGLIQVLVDPKGGGNLVKACWVLSNHFKERPCEK